MKTFEGDKVSKYTETDLCWYNHGNENLPYNSYAGSVKIKPIPCDNKGLGSWETILTRNSAEALWPP